MPAGIYLDEMFGPEVEQVVAGRARAAGLQVERAAILLPGGSDAEQLMLTTTRGLVLVTRNLGDFRWLHQQWHVLRRWGLLAVLHAGILAPAGEIESDVWAGLVMDLLLHPRCPTLDEQLLIWVAVRNQWESDHPLSRRRQRPVSF